MTGYPNLSHTCLDSHWENFTLLCHIKQSHVKKYSHIGYKMSTEPHLPDAEPEWIAGYEETSYPSVGQTNPEQGKSDIQAANSPQCNIKKNKQGLMVVADDDGCNCCGS